MQLLKETKEKGLSLKTTSILHQFHRNVPGGGYRPVYHEGGTEEKGAASIRMG